MRPCVMCVRASADGVGKTTSCLEAVVQHTHIKVSICPSINVVIIEPMLTIWQIVTVALLKAHHIPPNRPHLRPVCRCTSLRPSHNQLTRLLRPAASKLLLNKMAIKAIHLRPPASQWPTAHLRHHHPGKAATAGISNRVRLHPCAWALTARANRNNVMMQCMSLDVCSMRIHIAVLRREWRAIAAQDLVAPR